MPPRIVPEQKPILDALQTSIIVNRIDQANQIAWTQWRTGLVLVGGTPAQAGDLALLGPNGKFDPSVIPSSGSSIPIEVDGVLVPDQTLLNFVASTGISITYDNFGSIIIANTGATSTSFTDITSGTNTTATMVAGTGATITYTGGGIVNANQITGVTITNVPTSIGQTLVTTSPTTAQWQTGGGGTGNFVQALIDFGYASGGEGDTATVTVPAPWVTSASIILCNFPAISSPDHDPEDAVIEDLTASAGNVVSGVSFDITAYAPNGTWGRYYVNASGS